MGEQYKRFKKLRSLHEVFPDYTSWSTGQCTVIYKDFTDKQGKAVCVAIGGSVVQVWKELNGQGFMDSDRFDWCYWGRSIHIDSVEVMKCQYDESGAIIEVFDKARELFDDSTVTDIENAFRTLENQF